MKQISGRDFIRIIERKGWQLLRIHGSHHVFGFPGRRERITVPVHGNKPLKPGLLRHQMKIAGVEVSDL